MNVNSRWFQLGAALVGMIMIANFQYGWTLFVKPIQEGTGWKLSDVQWAFTLFILFQTWVQPAQGWLIDRMGPRWFITAAGVLLVFIGMMLQIAVTGVGILIVLVALLLWTLGTKPERKVGVRCIAPLS